MQAGINERKMLLKEKKSVYALLKHVNNKKALEVTLFCYLMLFTSWDRQN